MNTETQALQRVEAPPESFGAMVQRAIDKGVPVETMERLLAMYEKLQARQAKAEFDRALAAFQAECPTIQKTKKVMNKDGRSVRYQYAPLEVIVQQVKGLLEKHGFSYTVDAEVEPGLVRATCKATHQAGHSQTSSFSVPIDKDAYMNPAQQCASALTFAKRYAFVNAFGILTGDEDDDSQASHEPKSQAAQRQQTANVSHRTSAAGTAKPPGSEPGDRASSAPTAPPAQATEKTRAWFLAEMRKCFNDQTLLQWACDDGPPYALRPDESLNDWPLHLVPTTKEALAARIKRCGEFMGITAEPPKKPAGAPAPPSTRVAPAQSASKGQPAGKAGQSEPAHHSEEWYQFPMPFGKNAGTILGKLPKNYLYGLFKNYTVETTYNGKPKKKETIEADRQFRVMLDMAGVHYRFDEPKSDSGDDYAEAEHDYEPPF